MYLTLTLFKFKKRRPYEMLGYEKGTSGTRVLHPFGHASVMEGNYEKKAYGFTTRESHRKIESRVLIAGDNLLRRR